MRTSRIAKEAAQIANLLSPSKKGRTRSSLAAISVKRRGEQSNNSDATATSDVEHEESSLSPVSSDAFSSASPPPRKRKRGAPAPATPASAAVTVRATTRTSPRKKAVKSEDQVEIEDVIPNAKAKKSKVQRQPAKQVVDRATGEVKVHPPLNWQETYDAVREMRKTMLAPVDTMGCERLADETLSPKDQRFQTLVALMLSSQTKDTTNALAMARLRAELPSPGLTLSNILACPPDRLNELIRAVGFHNNKTRYIKATAEILRDRHAGDIPATLEGLLALPGVGPKMAYLCLSAAWGRTEGIGVDVHVHRITNLWGWHKTRGPEETRMALEAWLPREKWHEINHLLVGFGQTICTPVGRKCGECTLSERGLCPSAVVERKGKAKKVEKTAEVQVKAEDGVETVERGEVVVKREEKLAQDLSL